MNQTLWSWYFGQLPALSAVASFVELDTRHMGHFMLSRPIVLAPLIGALTGEPWTGLRIGVVMELLIMDELPVGGSIPINGGVAAASAMLLCAGPNAVEPAAAFPAGLALGLVFARADARVRSSQAGLMRRIESAIGQLRGERRALIRALANYALMTTLFIYAAVGILGPALAAVWTNLPWPVEDGLLLAYDVAPWLGLATATELFWRK